ncbi:site-2 protease family protein [Georgenia satyanarayanai]|uniref:site-2 protease family protein n=1 Tax=Georgenia satyanarayanai TaxID=860221 RepID=UPI00203ADF92|nr:site-2 protease family protein [Georgenia satyanarayanai]MCM3662102.1 site-2 protease family protein [Georgenia satyanarayanai]
MARLGERTSSGWVIGHVRRVPVVFAPSWFIMAIVLGTLVAPTITRVVPGAGTAATVLAAGSVPLMLLLGVLAHELAHGMAGHAVGSPPREYVLTLWGGHTQFTSDMRSPGASALVSVVGPLANAVLAGLSWIAVLQVDSPLASVVWQIAALSNAVVAIFNLLPGYPLDGGRILEAIVWKVTGDRLTGTSVAGWGGRVVAVLIVVAGLGRPLMVGLRPTIFTVLWVVLLAGYLWTASSQAVNLARARRNAAHIDLRLIAEPAVALPASAPVAAADAVGQRRIVLLDDGGRVSGLVDPSVLAQVPPHARPTTPLSAVASVLPAASVVTELLGADGVGAAARAARTSPVVVLADGPAGIVGVLTVDRLEEALRRAPR